MTAVEPPGTLPRRVRRRPRSAPPKDPLPEIRRAFFPLLDPLTTKELRGLSRSWQSYAGRVLYVGLIAFVLLRWWAASTSDFARWTSSEFAVLGRSLFMLFVPAQLALVTLASISAGSDMVLKEIRSGTIGLLDLASLSAAQITVSKWKAVVLSSTMLILSGLPVMAACIYLGGVGPGELIWSFTVAWSLAALGAALAIRRSCDTHSPIVAILKSIGLLVLIGLLVVPLGYAIWSRPNELQIPAWAVWMSAALAWTLRLLRSAAALVRRRIVDPLPPPRPLSDPELYESNYRRLSLRGPRVLVVQRRIWDRNELLWKEWVTRPAARLPLDARLVIAGFAAFLLFLVWLGSDDGWEQAPFSVVGLGFLLLATFNGAVLFASEKSGLKFDMLLSTPLSTRRIVLTKLASGLLTPEAGIVALLAVAGVRGWYSAAGWGGTIIAAGVSLLFLAFAYAVGAAASLYSRTVRTAVMSSGALIAALVIGLPWVAETLAPLGAGGLVRAAECLDVLRVLECFRRSTIDFGAGLRRALAFSAVHAGLILAILAAIFHRFRRITGRS